MNDVDMDTDMEIDDIPSPPIFSIEQHNERSTDPSTKMRKKPGRKPNPASPALRKAQNRVAQRNFRERKERHMRELEVAIKQIRDQRDKLYLENEQLKVDAEISRSENWYLKGIVLTLQLVCYQHNLVIPQHGPFVSEQALSLMAQSTPEPIAAYLSVNANSKLPTPTQLSGYRHSIKQRDRYLSSGAIVVTKDDVSQQQFPPLQSMTHPLERYRQRPRTDNPSDTSSTTSIGNDLLHATPNASTTSSSSSARSHSSSPAPPMHQHSNPGTSSERDEEGNLPMPMLSPVEQPHLNSFVTAPPVPRAPSIEPVTSNLAAIQTLRLRLRLQSACARMDSIPFSIQPSILQLTIPHDPRIDLIPTPHMRDRMILFREQFDLDDCFSCILHGAVFHGDDPGVAANWQLPRAFFEKYWFLTIDYTLRRTTNRWRRLQGLNDLENDLTKEGGPSTGDGNISDAIDTTTLPDMPALETQQNNRQQQQQRLQHPSSRIHQVTAGLPPSMDSAFGITDLSSYLGVEFSKLERQQQEQQEQQQNQLQDGEIVSESSDLPGLSSQNTLNVDNRRGDSFEPVRLTNGYLVQPRPKPATVRTTSTNINTDASISNRSNDPPITSLPSHHPSDTTSASGDIPSQHSKDPWENILLGPNQSGYDLLVNSFLHPDNQHS